MKTKYFIKLTCFALLLVCWQNVNAQNKKTEAIQSGFVFIDGKFIEPPYTVERKGMIVYLNDIQIVQEKKVLTKNDFLLPKKDCGIPPSLKKNDSIDNIYIDKVNEYNESYISVKLNYLYINYDFEIARGKALEYFRLLPNIKLAEGSDIVEVEAYNGDKRKIMIGGGSNRNFNRIFGPNGTGLPHKKSYVRNVNQQVQSIGDALRSGEIFFVFNDTTRFDDYAKFNLPSSYGKGILLEINDVVQCDTLSFKEKEAYVKENILKSNQFNPYLDILITNFSIDEERLK